MDNDATDAERLRLALLEVGVNLPVERCVRVVVAVRRAELESIQP